MIKEAQLGETDMVKPKWCFDPLPSPDPARLKNSEALQAAKEDIYHDTLDKHKILEQYPGIRADGPLRLIKAVSAKVLDNICQNGSGDGISTMSDAIRMIEDHDDFALFRQDHCIRMACESAVINAFWKYVRHEEHVDTPAALLTRWDDFKKERSHWWRAKRATDTADMVREKWDALLNDAKNLLNFHNVLLHTKKLLEKPTLKNTLHLAALTVEGRVYENGQGRSIASECRHIMVRKECNIPIKQRPDRKEVKVQTKRTTVGPPSSGGALMIPTNEPNYMEQKRRKLEIKTDAAPAPGGASASSSQPISMKDLTDDALSLLNFCQTAAGSPRTQEALAGALQESVGLPDGSDGTTDPGASNAKSGQEGGVAPAAPVNESQTVKIVEKIENLDHLQGEDGKGKLEKPLLISQMSNQYFIQNGKVVPELTWSANNQKSLAEGTHG